MEIVEAAVAPPGPGQLRVAVRSCGICGSDLHVFRGGGETRSCCPGHEIAGVVEDTGSDVRSFAPGDRIAVEPLTYCGQCRHCRTGNYHLCPRVELFGVHKDGGMASHLLIPDYAAHRLPDSVDFDLGALAEPLAVTVHAARLAGVGAGASVAVLGAGAVGLLAVEAARHLGAQFVAITARHPQQKDAAVAVGADQVLDPGDLRSLRQRPGAVIETVGGAADTIAEGVLCVERGGTVVMVGLFESTPVFDPLVMLMKEVRLVGSMVYNACEPRSDFAVALDILAERGESLRSLLTHHFDLTDIQRGFETAADKSSGALKVLLHPAS